jgi:hypothetical protein
MYYFKFFMPEGDGAAGGNMGGEAAPGSGGETPPTPPVGDLDDPKGEGTTPEEVAKILHIPTGKVGTAAPVEGLGEGEEEENAEGEENNGGEGDENTEGAPAGGGDAGAAGTGEGGEQPPAPGATPPAKPADAAGEGAEETPDFSITVEDKNGVTFKINAGDNIDEVLADFEPKNTGQIMDMIRQLDKVESQKAEYDAEQTKAAEQAERDERIQGIQEGWKGEITELQAAGRIPKVAEGSKNERVDAVYAFMGEENARRVAAGKPQLASFEDALDKLERNEQIAADEQAKKDAKAAAKKNGALVGGSSAPASNGPAPYRVGPNRPRNATQALKAQGVL